jgi:hypothetical protein
MSAYLGFQGAPIFAHHPWLASLEQDPGFVFGGIVNTVLQGTRVAVFPKRVESQGWHEVIAEAEDTRLDIGIHIHWKSSRKGSDGEGIVVAQKVEIAQRALCQCDENQVCIQSVDGDTLAASGLKTS